MGILSRIATNHRTRDRLLIDPINQSMLGRSALSTKGKVPYGRQAAEA